MTDRQLLWRRTRRSATIVNLGLVFGPSRMLVNMTEAPAIRLVNAILLSAIKQQATDLRIRRDGARSVVEFLIAGTVREEMQPPLVLHPVIVRRLAMMASLPTYAKGQSATGHIHLVLGELREAYFAIHVAGHGEQLEAQLRVITAAGMPGRG